jgi:hypothetical protein
MEGKVRIEAEPIMSPVMAGYDPNEATLTRSLRAAMDMDDALVEQTETRLREKLGEVALPDQRVE